MGDFDDLSVSHDWNTTNVDFVTKQLAARISGLKVRMLSASYLKLLSEPGFLEAFSENHYITYFYSGDWHSENFKEAKMKLSHIEALNKGGRRILKEEAVPLSLWPLVLERANRVTLDGYYEKKAKVPDILFCLIRGGVGRVVGMQGQPTLT